MAFTVDDVVSSARHTLLDASGVAWTDAELIGYVNEALEATSGAKTDLYTVRANLEMQAGSLQELPAGGISLIDLLENTYGGGPISVVDKDLLDACNRFLTAADQEREVEHFTADPRDPRRFLVSPPNDGTGEVRAVYAIVHPAIAALVDSIDLDNIYKPVLIDYVLHRAYAKNSLRQDLAKSGYHKQQWGQALGLNSRSQAAIAPKVSVSEGK
jgi:hypothetical protein